MLLHVRLLELPAQDLNGELEGVLDQLDVAGGAPDQGPQLARRCQVDLLELALPAQRGPTGGSPFGRTRGTGGGTPR